MWYDYVKSSIANEKLHANIHSALLHRYTYLLYSIDMAMFYDLQQDYYYRRSIECGQSLLIGYYLTHFYLLLWGMLDHFAVIAKYKCDLDIDERHVGIRSSKFKKKLSEHHPDLVRFIESEMINEWIEIIADMRHQAAHKVIATPSDIVVHTDESQMSDEEVWELIKDDEKWILDLPTDSIESIKALKIYIWKTNRLQRISHNMIVINKKDGRSYCREAIGSLNYDIDRLNVFIDAFMFTLWG